MTVYACANVPPPQAIIAEARAYNVAEMAILNRHATPGWALDFNTVSQAAVPDDPAIGTVEPVNYDTIDPFFVVDQRSSRDTSLYYQDGEDTDSDEEDPEQ